MESKIELNLRK